MSSSNQPAFAVCLANDGYAASLTVRRLYRVLPDSQADARGLLRIVDESGEDYLYPAHMFARVDLPDDITKRLSTI